MTWKAKIRGKSGSFEEVTIEASTRRDAFAELKRRGLTAMSLSEVRGGESAGKMGSRSVLRGILAGVAIVVLGSVALWFFLGSESEPVKEPKPSKVAVKPVKAVDLQPVRRNIETNAVVVAPKKVSNFPWLHNPNTNGLTELQCVKWRAFHRPPPGFTNRLAGTEHKARYEIFKHHSENTIATYLTMEPGEGLVGTPRYGPSFKRNFLKSLEEPIEIKPDDSEYDRNLKIAVRDAKIELKKQMDAGEDLGEMLLATHREYQELARYKGEINALLKEQLKGGESLTEADIDDFVSAANRMLEDKGIAPIKVSALSKRLIMYNRSRQQKRQLSEQSAPQPAN